MPETRPNILLITSDQQHYDTLGVTNPRIKTPSLDRLVAEGTRFDRAYCPNPTCTPTRASLITGMYPSQHGAWTLGTKLYEDVPVVGDQFQSAGYATGLLGKGHFQTLYGAEGMESLESHSSLRDLDFWRGFHGPWYGFEHVELNRNHAFDLHVGQHYAIWMEDNGLPNWRDYFEDWPRDGKSDKYKQLSAKRVWELPEEFHYNRWTADRTIAHIERSLAEGRPFLTWASFPDPHPFCTVPQPWASMYDPAKMVPGTLTPGEHDRNPLHFRLTQEPGRPDFSAYRDEDGGIGHGFHSHLKDANEFKKELAAYYGMISMMDHHIGRILDALERVGAADNTLVVFTSDHGHFLGQHGLHYKGAFHYEDMIRVPMIVRWPGHVPAGAVSEAIQSLVDYAPTFLAAAGMRIPGVMTGVSQLETWRGGQAVRDHAIVENHHNSTKIHLRTYVTDRYKITVYRTGDHGELFDLQEDPGEVNNLWHDPAAEALRSRMLYELVQAILAYEPMRMPRIAGA